MTKIIIYKKMFRDFLSFINCCKKRKNEDKNGSFSDGDYEKIAEFKKPKNTKNNIKLDIKDRIDIDGNLEYENFIVEKEGG